MKKDILMIVHIMGNMEPTDNDRFTYLANLLLLNGNDVEIVTSDFLHSTKTYRNCEETLKKWNFKITFLHEKLYKKNVSFKRIAAHNYFSKELKKYLRVRKKPDSIYLAFPPIGSANATVDYATKNNIPLVVDIQDLWPEAFSIKFGNNYLIKLLSHPAKRKENRVFQKSSTICSVSNEYTERALRVCKTKKPSIVAYLGSDGSKIDNIISKHKETKSDGLKHIVYLGNLGNNYDFVNVFKALDVLRRKGRKDIFFDVVGDGDRKKEIEQLSSEYFDKTKIWGYLPYSDAIDILLDSYLALNPLVPTSSSSIVNKVGDYAAASIPVVNSQEGDEYKALINEYKCGLNARSGDYIDIANKIEFLLDNPEIAKSFGEANRRLFKDKFDRRNSYQNIVKALTQ